MPDAGADASPPDAAQSPLRIETDELPAGELGGLYDFVIEAEGGVPPHAFELSRGALPAGVWLQPEGRIASPAIGAEGEFVPFVEVTDWAGGRAEKGFVLRVARELALSGAPLPRAYVGWEYDASIDAAGGRAPRRFELVAGALPEGLSLEEGGRIRGMPAAAGEALLRIRVTDAAGAEAVRDASLVVWGPIAAVDRTVRDVRLCFSRRLFRVPVDRAFQVESVQVAVRISAADVSRMVLTLLSPSGSEVYLRTVGEEASEIDAVFGADEESLEPLDWLAGEPALGTWTLTLYDPRCPYPATVEEVALVFADVRGASDYVRIEGWTASREAGRPSLRVAGGGLDQSALTLQAVRWSTGADGIAQGGAGDDERLAILPATWSTTLDPSAATIDEQTGLLTAGTATGSGRIEWETEGASGSLPVAIYPPDWVP